MKIDFRRILIILVAASAASCTGYNKLLKSKDSDLKYHKAIEYCEAGKYNKALALFQDISHIYAQSARADTVAYYTGLTLYKMGDFDSSAELFDGFRRRFGRSPFLEEAEFMYAKGFYFSSPDPSKDQTSTHQAMMAISEYLERYPNSPKKEALLENIIELRQKLYDKAYLNAKVYYKIGYYNSAVTALKNAIKEYPESDHREELAYLIVSSHCHYARNSVEHLQRQRYLDTQDAYYNFIEEYPESQYRKETDKMLEEAKAYLDKYNKTHQSADTQAATADPNQTDNSGAENGSKEK